MFEELLKSVREGGAILRGQKKPSRRFEIGPSGILAIHERTSLSQSEFARLIGVSVKTLQNWEQSRRRSGAPALFTDVDDCAVGLGVFFPADGDAEPGLLEPD